MGKLTSQLLFTGTVGHLTAYRQQGVEGIVVRTRGSASRAARATAPAFASVRRNNAEFAGRSTATRWLLRMLGPQHLLADHNIAGPLNALLKPIQVLDDESPWGQRAIRLSQQGMLLAGFSLNRKNPLTTVVRPAISCVLQRSSHTATVSVPALLPGVNLFHPGAHPFFRLQWVLGAVPDLHWRNPGYAPAAGWEAQAPAMVCSPWWPCLSPVAAQEVDLVLPFVPPSDRYCLLLSMGVAYGRPGPQGEMETVRYAGSAGIVAVA